MAPKKRRGSFFDSVLDPFFVSDVIQQEIIPASAVADSVQEQDSFKYEVMEALGKEEIELKAAKKKIKSKIPPR